MADFQILMSKSSSGDILVIGNYRSGNEPVFVERVVIEEMDSSGDAVFGSSHHVHRSIDPRPGGYLLVSKRPSGSRIKSARAKAYYIEIEEIAESDTLNL